MDGIRKLFAKIAGKGKKGGYWVRGSGFVNVPENRLSEIPKVIAEYHTREAERARPFSSIRRA